MKRLLFLALPLAAVALLVSNCTVIYGEKATEDYSESYAIADGYNLINMDNKAGNIAIVTTEDDSIHVTYTKSCMGTTVEEAKEHLNDITIILSGNQNDSTITISTDFPDVDTRNFQVTFTLWVPDTMDLDIVNTTGNVDINGLSRQPTRLETTSGNITVKGFNCGVDAKATTGNVDCEIVSLPANKSVKLATTTGTTTLKVLAMDTTNTIGVTGKSGSVDITLPSTVQLSFDMSVTSGEVRINGFVPTQGSPWGNTHKVGTIGTGTTKSILNAVTETGDITLNKGD